MKTALLCLALVGCAGPITTYNYTPSDYTITETIHTDAGVVTRTLPIGQTQPR